MADGEDEDLQMAIRMSLHGSPPDAKRSKPLDSREESLEARNRRLQRELRADAAERRLAMMAKIAEYKREVNAEAAVDMVTDERKCASSSGGVEALKDVEVERNVELGEELSPTVVEQLFSMLFGSDVSAGILARWSKQGIRFSSDPETSICLVQYEGGPCGVLAAMQAYVLKYLIFSGENSLEGMASMALQNSRRDTYLTCETSVMENFKTISEDMKERALVRSMVEILFLCGNGERAVVASLATLNVSRIFGEDGRKSEEMEEIISRALEGLTILSASDLQKVLRISIFRSEVSIFDWLMINLPVFRSRLGAMLFLISALLSRGLDSVQGDRDDPSLPLVTAPFGHASQEIVNLLLCGQAAPNVFDGRMDLGGGMFLKGIPGNVEVGFLTLLESLNFCKVGQYLKCPKWPIWVVGSESHYTVIFALDTSIQDENELEQRESLVRRAFDAQDQSGGGGFISVDGFHKVLNDMGISLPSENLNGLSSSGYIVWSEFWQVLLNLDKESGGFKDSATSGKKQFDLFHLNGIAKSVSNGSQVSEGELPVQRPRICKLSVSVPPSWTQEEFLADVVTASSNEQDSKNSTNVEVDQLLESPQHAPLVDCIRTRWPRAVCRWVGDPPSIV